MKANPRKLGAAIVQELHNNYQAKTVVYIITTKVWNYKLIFIKMAVYYERVFLHANMPIYILKQTLRVLLRFD